MRLLHTTTLDLNELIGDVPPYAILSHTWEYDEVSLQDLASPSGRSKRGFRKIEACSAQARRDGYDWVWVDTCCIDKTSSAELSEAINSMFRWYQRAEVCYVYLSDLPSQQPGSVDRQQFHDVKWFTRGWTLQELIAPRVVEFYDQNWDEIGTRLSLIDLLHDRTGIPAEILNGKSSHSSICIGERMSWASTRKTTRQEDLAYCLLGIFGIHMPLLYGEGPQAFIRLQQEILRTAEDLSLLLWTRSPQEPSTYGVLAPTPSAFQNISVFDLQGYAFNPFSSWNWKHVIVDPLSPVPESHWPSSVASTAIGAPPTITTRGLHVQLPAILLDGGLRRLLWLRCLLVYSNAGSSDQLSGYLCIEVQSFTPNSNLPAFRGDSASIYCISQTDFHSEEAPRPMYLTMSHDEPSEHRRLVDKFIVSLDNNGHAALRLTVRVSKETVGTSWTSEPYTVDAYHLKEFYSYTVWLQYEITHSESPQLGSCKVTVGVKCVPGGDRLGCCINASKDAQTSIWEALPPYIPKNSLYYLGWEDAVQTESDAAKCALASKLVGAGPWTDRCAKNLPGDQYVFMAAIKMSRRVPMLVLSIKTLSGRR